MPLVLPGEAGVGAVDFNIPNNENGKANEGNDDNSLAKGNGKRLERSKSFIGHVMTNRICACCG